MLSIPAHPAPDPHRTHLQLAQDLLAVSLHPWRWFCHPPLLCVTWALLLHGTSPPELDQSPSQVGSPTLGS